MTLIEFSEEDNNFSIISALYHQARNTYLKTEETIQSMFDELNHLPF